MFDTSYRGLWSIHCDEDGCNSVVEINGHYDLTPSKQNTIALARRGGWKIGKKHLCWLHSGKRSAERIAQAYLPE